MVLQANSDTAAWTAPGLATCTVHSKESPATDSNWIGQAEMWVELEVHPVLKCNFPYICEDI